MKNIYCLNNISKIGLNALSGDYQVVDEIGRADAILVRSAKMHEMELPKSVLAVARAGAGVNNIPLDIYAQKGIVVFNTPGANANGVKELTIAGMLLASRDIVGGINWLQENQDDPEISKSVEKAKAQFSGTEIHGKTIGIIGLGAIGILLAKSCAALGMKVMGVEKNLETLEDKLDILPKDMMLVKTKEEMYPYCDFISLNLPLNNDTKDTLNNHAFSIMKDGVIVLNFARDGLVNDDDLKEAISIGKVRKYVTDFPNPKTAQMDGVIAIPHLGASTEEAEDNCAMMAANQIQDYINHGCIKNAVNFPDLEVDACLVQSRVMILYKHSKYIQQYHKQIQDLFTDIEQFTHAENAQYGVSIIDCHCKVGKDIETAIQKLDETILLRIIK